MHKIELKKLMHAQSDLSIPQLKHFKMVTSKATDFCFFVSCLSHLFFFWETRLKHGGGRVWYHKLPIELVDPLLRAGKHPNLRTTPNFNTVQNSSLNGQELKQ